jgi:prepilin-type N-terminal cleavage/methylation domain-containing protein
MIFAKSRRHHHRPGFTLVELMVVVAIIGVLVTLVTSAAMQVISYQRNSTTEATITTLASLLDQQWRAVIDQANKETIPASVMNMAGNDVRRARVIWTKLRLKQEFPMNFTEALNPFMTPNGSYLSASDLPPRSAYVSALRGIPASTDPQVWPTESSACLLLALQQGRRGISLSEDSLSVSALASRGPGLRQLVDGWGMPLYFYRWPTLNDDLDRSSPSGPYNPADGRSRDPLDPEGLLLDPNWNNKNNQGVAWFERYCHLVHDPHSLVYKPRSFYAVPVIASAGRDLALGMQRITHPLLPDPMQVDITNPTPSSDNIYSYRLRLGGRGGQ